MKEINKLPTEFGPFHMHPPKLPEDKYAPLIIELARLFKRDFHNSFADSGLFPGQEHMIITIEHHEGITASALADYFRLSLATVSVSVKRMEKSGFIKKVHDEKDARIVHLYLTDKAKACTSKLKQRCARQEEVITAGMSEEEKKQFYSLLQRAVENMKKEVVPDDEK